MKKLFSALLCLCLLLSCVVMTAIATDGTHTDHHACSCVLEGVTCTESHGETEEWVAWSYGTTFEAGKNYYLTDNVVLTGNQAIGIYVENVVLCLNGHSITADSTRTANKFLLQVGASGKVANVTLMNCKTTGGVTNCVSGNGSGAVQLGHLNTASTLKVIGVTFNNNQETHDNANYGGGAIHVRNGNLTTEYCTFSGNKVTGTKGSGGAINVYLGSVNAKNTAFTGNQAVQYGGAVCLRDDSNATLQLTDCTFSGNQGSYGAAIYHGKGCTVNAARTSFTENTGTYGTIYTAASTGGFNGVTMSGNTNDLYVGSSYANITLSGASQMHVNLAKDATTLYVGALSQGANVHVTTLTDDETAAFLTVGDGFATASWVQNPDWIFYDNLNSYIGYDAQNAKFYINYHDHHACDCVITGESCTHETDVLWEPWTDSTKLPNANGNHYYLTTDVVLSGKATITAAKSYLCLNGHTISMKDGVTGTVMQVGSNGNAVEMILMDCRTAIDTTTGEYVYKGGISDQTDSAGGGAVQLGHKNTASSLNLIGVQFAGNEESMANAGYGGGAIHVRNGELNAFTCDFSNNNATGTDVGSGGAISVYSGSITAQNTTFSGNTAVQDGGAVYLNNSGTATLIDCTFTGNTAGRHGSVVYAGPNCTVVIDGATSAEGIYLRKEEDTTGDGALTVKTGFTGAVKVDTKATVKPGDTVYEKITAEGTFTGKISVLGTDDTYYQAVYHNGALIIPGYVGVKGASETAIVDLSTAADYDYIKLLMGGEITLTADTPFDLNGKTVAFTPDSYILQVFDTTTDTFGASAGSYTVSGETTVVVRNPVTGSQYLNVEDGEGNWSANRVLVEMTKVSIKTTKAGVYYTTRIRANAGAASALTNYGTALSLKKMPSGNFEDPDVAKTEGILYTIFTLDVEEAVDINTRSALIANILKENAEDPNNDTRGKTDIFASSFVTAEVNGQKIKIMADVSYTQSLEDMMGMLDTKVATLDKVKDATTIQTAVNFYEKWTDPFAGWTLPNLKALSEEV